MKCIPSADHGFREAATAALAAMAGRDSDEVATALAEFLRPTYPAVAVHRQDPLARIDDEDVWYAYREGKPRPETRARYQESAANHGLTIDENGDGTWTVGGASEMEAHQGPATEDELRLLLGLAALQ